MEIKYLQLYKDTYLIFMQVYKTCKVYNINLKNYKKRKNVLSNKKYLLLVKLKS